MRATRNTLLLGALALAAAALAPAANATPGYIRLPGVFYFQLELGRIDGYALSAFGNRGQVLVTAEQRGTTATYSARGFANRHRLQVDLGRFGRIAVRLKRSRRLTHQQLWFEGCHGRPPWQLHGVVSGRIRFRGLGAFVSIDKRRAKAEVVRTFDAVCKREPGSIYAVGRGTRDRQDTEKEEGPRCPHRRRLFGSGRAMAPAPPTGGGRRLRSRGLGR